MPSCPFCEDDSDQLNNHIRMSNDEEHGPTQSYPDDWDSDAQTRTESNTSNPEGQTDETAGNDLLNAQSGNGVYDDDGSRDLEADDVTDDSDEPEDVEPDDDDAKTYNCGNCGESLEYLQKTCPSCDGQPQWSAIDAAEDN